MANLSNSQVDTLIATELTNLLLSPDMSTWSFTDAINVASAINDAIGADTVNGIIGRYEAVTLPDGRVAVNYVVDLADN